MKRCPKVLAMIEEVEALDEAGRCWCECVKEDIPHARELVEAGKCLGASQVIRAARRRCTAPSEVQMSPIQPLDIRPLEIKVVPIAPMSFGPQTGRS